MPTIRFNTGNPGKLREAQRVLAAGGYTVEASRAPATEIQADTHEAVALQKAASLVAHVPAPFFLEDAGLFIQALNGFPGVYTAHALQTLGLEGVLRTMDGVRDRRAEFRSVVALVDDGIRLFNGRVAGTIAHKAAGQNGFGFDPIFIPNGWNRTFAEAPDADKDAISHRADALRALAEHLAARR